MKNDNFRLGVSQDLEDFLLRAQSLVPEADRVRIDLHCHDANSDRPDERLGRILGVPETWLGTDDLIRTLRSNGTDLVTVTNHNDARTCWQLLDRGMDVLVGAEFSCTLPDFEVGIHVLTYGFDPRQETQLARLRRDVYRFVDYCNENDIVTVLAHPLQFHSPKGLPPMEVMDRLGLLFDRFEVVNGQRDSWQNLLTASWVEGMDEEELHAMAKRARQPLDLFALYPYRKRMMGGSDDHMGMFAGSTGTYLRIPNWREASKSIPLSKLALQALRHGDSAPYGGSNEEEKLAAALLDYFCQVSLNMEDPGLLRVLLHQGDPADKALALAVANGVFELRRHKVTMRFLEVVHEAFAGRSPGLVTRLGVSKDFRPLLAQIASIARARRNGSKELARVVDTALPALFRQLGQILSKRIEEKVKIWSKSQEGEKADKRPWIERLELPAHARRIFEGGVRKRGEKLSVPKLPNIVDGLPYPLLAASVLAGASYAAARVLHEKRPFLDAFSERLGKHVHPHRALWLTDTFEDRNGVSSVLRSMLDEIRRKDLPIDILVCSDTLQEEDHLRVLPPLSTLQVPMYPQPLRIPDLLAVQKLFSRGGYDRLVCSTEGPLGVVGLYLKHAFEVPAWFFMHTDWMDFARTSLGWDRGALSRLRRILRAFYRSFDGVFVLNSDHKEWLTGPQMGLASTQVHTTAHWPDSSLRLVSSARREEVFPGVGKDQPVLLYAGRLSQEKGVLELASILDRVRMVHPGTRLVLAGTGPAENQLRQALPDALFLGWLDADELSSAYSAADLLVLPSRFDTFGCVVVEAMRCGLPVAAYSVKGPKDIVQPGLSGVLADTSQELSRRIVDLLSDPARLQQLREGAIRRACDFAPEIILDKLLADLGLGESPVRRPAGNTPSPGVLFGEVWGWMQGAR